MSDPSRSTRIPVLIGEAPSAGSDPARPFSGLSGDRLRRIADVDRFELRNLFDAYPGRKTKGTLWDALGARERADLIAPGLEGRRAVLAGRRVATAFRHPRLPWMEWVFDARGFWVAAIPHPSGIVRWWNDPENVAAARRFLQGAII